MLYRAAALSARRPLVVLGLMAVLAVVGFALALRLAPDGGVDTLVAKSTASYRATATYRARFGDDPIIVLVRGDLTKLLLTQDLQRLIGLEGCISGNTPAHITPPGGANGPCGRLRSTHPVKVVFGPGTFINEATRQLGAGIASSLQDTSRRSDDATKAARRGAQRQGLGPAATARRVNAAQAAVARAFQAEVTELAVRYGLRSIPRVDDPNFVSTLVFDQTKPAGTPKHKFAYFFPVQGNRRGRTALDE